MFLLILLRPNADYIDRWNWDSPTFNIRMPTLLHDNFTKELMSVMISQINSFNSEKACVMDSLSRLHERHSADVALSLRDKEISRAPDASLALFDDNFPILVLETAYSQRGEDLKKIAHQYLIGSDGNIRLMIGCNIEYGLRSRKATISLWQPDFMINPKDTTRTILKSIPILDNDVMLFWMSTIYINSSN